MLVFTNERFIFRVLRQEIESGGTNNVNSQMVVFGVLEGGLREFGG